MNPLVHFLESLNFRDWWLLAIVLAIVDVFVLRHWLVIPAIAAGVVGFVLMLFPQITWPWQLGGFVMITLVGIAICWKRSAKSPVPIPAEPHSPPEQDHEQLP